MIIADSVIAQGVSPTTPTIAPQANQPVADTDPMVADSALPLLAFRPRSQLRVPQTELHGARFPVVDVHTHFAYKGRENPQLLADYLELMDRNQIAVCASLDAVLSETPSRHFDFLWSRARDRFVIFVHLDWQGTGDREKPAEWACNQPEFARHTVAQLEAAKRAGASGLKVFKQLGLGYRDADGKLLRIDDPRWDPIWAACGQLGLPVLFHVADPLAFFDPIDETNERFEELIRHPEWSFHGNGYPTHQELMSAFERVLERHPQTDFIGAHMASLAEDLAGLGKLLDRHPNLYLDIASRIAELGRQPFTARAFLLRYQDRILFGTDGPWPESRLVAYWRFLETHDEYFPYSEKEFPPQGFWQIYGVALPEETLRAIYSGNAARLIPGVAERLETWSGAQPALQPPPSQANPGDPSAAPSDQSSPPSAE